MSHLIHRLLLPVVFPEGIHPGEGQQGNKLTLARDGQGRSVLRGTSLAGALRHSWARLRGVRPHDLPVRAFFGEALDGKEGGLPSPLQVPDCVIESGGGVLMRNHNAINRHTGAVLGSGLFSLESLPPGSHATVCLWLDETEMMTQDGGCSAKEFFADILSLLEAGLSLGGSAARGVGRVAMDGKALYKVFDCKNLEQQAALLDEHRAWRCGKVQKTGDSLSPSEAERTRVLTVELELAIPQGEDLLIGDGQGVDYDIEPQRVRCVDGVIRWKIPGSSLRGVFRGWFTRLAVRSGRPVADSLASKLERDAKGGVYSGDAVAWGFDSAAVRERKQDALMQDPARLESEVPCPIMRLFGSCYSKGRIQVADALSTAPQSPAQEQLRAHVAVDRITGGASEGFFFTNSVLSGEVKFPVTITVQDPGEDEVRWLRSTLRALHVGILRVGSSKAGGRLRLAGEVKAAGPFAELLKETSISEV